MSLCIQCGKKLRSESLFCPHCGAKQSLTKDEIDDFIFQNHSEEDDEFDDEFFSYFKIDPAAEHISTLNARNPKNNTSIPKRDVYNPWTERPSHNSSGKYANKSAANQASSIKHTIGIILRIILCIVAVFIAFDVLGYLSRAQKENGVPAETWHELTTEDLSNHISEKTETEIISKTDDSVTVRVLCPDVADLLKQYLESGTIATDFDAEYNQLMSDITAAIQSGQCQMIEREITLPIQTIDGVQTIIYTDEYYDAVNGGMLSVFTALLGGELE